MNSHLFITSKSRKYEAGELPVLFLHGFSGSANDWKDFLELIPEGFFPLALNLPGHGNNICNLQAENYSSISTSNQIKAIIDELNFQEIIIVGYSMGGRAALSFSNIFPYKVKGLFLESTSPGIDNPEERIERNKKDKELAGFILNNTIEKFVDYWMDQPLFSTLKNLTPEIVYNIKKSKQGNKREGLANSLRGFGTGIMPPLWNSLSSIHSPVYLITGELDEKFTLINKEMKKLLPKAGHTVIKNCGHNVHLENPEEFLNVLVLFLNQF